MTSLSGLHRKVLQKEQRISREIKGNGEMEFYAGAFIYVQNPQCLDDSDSLAYIFSQISVQCIGHGWVCKLMNLCSLLPEPSWWNTDFFL